MSRMWLGFQGRHARENQTVPLPDFSDLIRISLLVFSPQYPVDSLVEPFGKQNEHGWRRGQSYRARRSPLVLFFPRSDKQGPVVVLTRDSAVDYLPAVTVAPITFST